MNVYGRVVHFHMNNARGGFSLLVSYYIIVVIYIYMYTFIQSIYYIFIQYSYMWVVVMYVCAKCVILCTFPFSNIFKQFITENLALVQFDRALYKDLMDVDNRGTFSFLIIVLPSK